MILSTRHIGLITAGMLLAAGGGWAAGLPEDLVKRLQAEKYAEREKAGAELLAWARLRPAEAADTLYEQSRAAPEAEVRGRCLETLRTLVDEEYQRDGVGYMGILMNQVSERVDVAGEAKPRFGIRLLQVVNGTPASEAGLVAGDVMLGIDAHIWREGDSSQAAMDIIKGFKPGIKVSITLFRAGKVVVMPLVLGKRPAAADLLFGFGEPPPREVAEALEKSAKDEYFRRWMAGKRARAQ